MKGALKLGIPFLVVVWIFAGHAQAKTYKCKDTEGNTVFSDTACNAVAREEMKLDADQSNGNLDQEAIKNCLDHLKRTQLFADPDRIKIANSQFDWVAVKGIGSRRMLTLSLRVVNQSGLYGDAVAKQCLMLGDGRTVSTYPYELLDKN